MTSSFSTGETHADPILDAFREELIEGVEHGPETAEKAVAAWCARYPDRDDVIRNEAAAIRLLWGLREPERLLETGRGKPPRSRFNHVWDTLVCRTNYYLLVMIFRQAKRQHHRLIRTGSPRSTETRVINRAEHFWEMLAGERTGDRKQNAMIGSSEYFRQVP
jgi:hypothetical protein